MINLQDFQELAQGAHGIYYKLNNTLGVKIIRSKTFKTVREANKSRAHGRAIRESELLTEALESGVVPRCYGVTLVKVRNGYRVGILMQHLGNKRLAETEHIERGDIYEDIHEKLMELGIDHGDLHEDNIMVYRGKFYAIDFSPQCVSSS